MDFKSARLEERGIDCAGNFCANNNYSTRVFHDTQQTRGKSGKYVVLMSSCCIVVINKI